jgi:pyridoxine/pyridoxamine 5'-phosphate oxidase
MPQENSEISADDLATRLWQELTRALHDRHHEWRTPILATQGVEASGPQARTVVLRHADAASWTLGIYTDARSPKCLEVQSQPLAQLIFWSKRLSWQLRVSALVNVEVEGEHVNAAWERVRQTRAAADYLGALPPGHNQTVNEPTAADSVENHSAHHLAVLSFKVTSLDWLFLNREGHRRARLTPSGTLAWLVP